VLGAHFNEFLGTEKIERINEGTSGFETVGGFLFYFLPSKSEGEKILLILYF